MAEEFAIPAAPGDLIEATGCEGLGYYVDDSDIRADTDEDIAATIDGVVHRLIAAPAVALAEHENFDAVYVLLRAFSAIGDADRNRLVDVLVAVVDRLVQTTRSELAMGTASKELCNVATMQVWLVQWLFTICEGEAREAMSKKMASAQQRGKKVREPSLADDWDWPLHKVKLLSSLADFFSLPLGKMWGTDHPPAEFLHLAVRICSECFRNLVISKDAGVRLALWKLILRVAGPMGHASAVCSHMAAHIKADEALVSPTSDLVTKALADPATSPFVGELVGELAADTYSDTDKSGARFVGMVLCDIATQAPQVALDKMSCLLPHLGGESYSIRSAVVDSIAKALAGPLVNNKDEEQLREALIDTLLDRAHDVSGYTRARVMQAWTYLVRCRVVPVKRFNRVVDASIDRLADRVLIVRKNALHLLSTILEFNPFTPDLRLEPLEHELKVARAKLEELGGDKGDGEGEDDNVDANEGDDEGHDEDASNNDEVKEEKTASDNPARAAKILVMFYEDTTAFVRKLQESVPQVGQLLASKGTGEVQEAVDFFVAAHRFHLDGAQTGLGRMLFLMVCRDEAIRASVAGAYRKLFLTPPADLDLDRGGRSVFVAANLIKLVDEASLAELTSLESLLAQFMHDKLIDDGVVRTVFDILAGRINGASQASRRAGACLLAALAAADGSVIRTRRSALAEHALAADDAMVVQFAAQALCKAGERLALPHDDVLVQVLETVLENETWSLGEWLGAAEQALNALYVVAARPEDVAMRVLHATVTRTFGTSATAPSRGGLGRTLFLVGHIALCELVHIEATGSRLKRARANRQAGLKASGSSDDEGEDEEGIAEELGLAAAAMADEQENELLQQVTETELVTGDGALAEFAPLLIKFAASTDRGFADVVLCNIATLALCKFMAVSSDFCEGHLQLLFTILERVPEAEIRRNVVVALGDLAFRFPNAVEPWSLRIYARLRDEDASVRKTTLMALMHLILNDMLKLKGQISEMALCLVDEEERIREWAQLFFNTLAQKGNAVYNLLPDAVSALSGRSDLPDADYHRIMTTLFSFVGKDKQAEALVEKLCQRFRSSQDPAYWRRVAFCISQLTLSDKGLKRLADAFKCYQSALASDEVYKRFKETISKAKRGGGGFAAAGSSSSSGEVKSVAEELEQMMAKAREEMAAEDAAEEEVMRRKPREESAGVSPTEGGSPARSESKKGREEEEDEEEPVDKTEPTPPKPKSKKKKSVVEDDEEEPVVKTEPTLTKPKSKKKKSRVVEDDEDEEEEPVVKTEPTPTKPKSKKKKSRVVEDDEEAPTIKTEAKKLKSKKTRKPVADENLDASNTVQA